MSTQCAVEELKRAWRLFMTRMVFAIGATAVAASILGQLYRMYGFVGEEYATALAANLTYKVSTMHALPLSVLAAAVAGLAAALAVWFLARMTVGDIKPSILDTFILVSIPLVALFFYALATTFTITPLYKFAVDSVTNDTTSAAVNYEVSVNNYLYSVTNAVQKGIAAMILIYLAAIVSPLGSMWIHMYKRWVMVKKLREACLPAR